MTICLHGHQLCLQQRMRAGCDAVLAHRECERLLWASDAYRRRCYGKCKDAPVVGAEVTGVDPAGAGAGGAAD